MIVRKDSLAPIAFEGLEVYDYTVGLDGRSSLAAIEVPPGARHPEAYSTRSEKLYLVTAGSLRFSIAGKVVELATGDFCHVPQEVRFWYENATSRPAALVLVHTPSFDLEAEVTVER